MIEKINSKSESKIENVETPKSVFEKFRENRRAIMLGLLLSMGVSVTGNISQAEGADYFRDLSPIVKHLDNPKHLNMMLASLDQELTKAIQNTGDSDINKIEQLSKNIDLVKSRIKEARHDQDDELRTDREQESSHEVSDKWDDVTTTLGEIFEQRTKYSEEIIQAMTKGYKNDKLFFHYLNGDINQLNTWIQIMRTHNLLKSLNNKSVNQKLANYDFKKYNSLDEILADLRSGEDYTKAKAQQKLRWYNNQGKQVEKLNLFAPWDHSGTGPELVAVDTSDFAKHLREAADTEVDQKYLEEGKYDEKKDQAIIVQFLLDRYGVNRGNWYRVMNASVADFLENNVKDTEGFLGFGENQKEFKTLQSKLKSVGALPIDQSVSDFIYDHIDQLY